MKKIVLTVVMVLLAAQGMEATPQAEQKADQPTTCPVSGEKVGEMGPPVTIDYNGKKVSFCCDSCIAKFQKDPVKYLAKPPAKP